MSAVPAIIATKQAHRKLKIIVITGTDGKTTTCSILAHLLNFAGHKTGLITTINAQIGTEKFTTGYHVTSPSPSDLHDLLAKMVEAGCEYVVLEVTSHGSFQHRIFGIKPVLSGVTNIAQEHLDYHLTYRNYVQAKTWALQSARHVFLNKTDQSFSLIKKLLPKPARKKIKTYSDQDVLPKLLDQQIKSRFPEPYNQLNARLAVALAQKLGVPNSELSSGFKTFPAILGRMDLIQAKPVKVIVDFAHTPQGMEAVLTALRAQLMSKNSQLWVVFGCAGLRDHYKRPQMGKISSRLAHQVILTAEDPRTEDVWSIIHQIKGGVEQHHKVISIPDRQTAINHAIHNAKKSDIVAILGKGHEESMCFGTTEYPWSDHEAARLALEKL